jgi:predicted peptidase
MIRSVKKYSMGEYIEYLPNDYQEKQYHVILFLHGWGERGSDINLVERNEIPEQLKMGFEAPAIVIAPQLPLSQGGYYQAFWSAIKPVLESYKAPRYHIAGLSLGGYGVFYLMSYENNFFFSAGCCCGADVPKKYDFYKNVHIKGWHGSADGKVKMTSVEGTVNVLKSMGADAALKVYPGLGHDIWNLAFSSTDPESYWAWVKPFLKDSVGDNIEPVTKIEIVNGQRVRYTVDGTFYEHDL